MRVRDTLVCSERQTAGGAGELKEKCRPAVPRLPAHVLTSRLADVKGGDGVKFCAADGTWLMLRGSVTEPILRIHAEAKSARMPKSC